MSIKEDEDRGISQQKLGTTQEPVSVAEEKSDYDFDEEWKQGEPWLKRRWKMLAGLLCLLVIAGGAYYWFFMRTSVAATPFTTAQVTRGNISVTVSSDGQVAPKQALDLSFPSAEKVTDVLVKPGDSVKSGQPLAKIDATTLQNNLNTAQAGLKSAQAALDDLMKGSTTSDIAAAQSAVNADAQKLGVVKQGPKPTDVAAAQSNLDSAKAKLQALQDGPTPANLSAAQAKVAQAQSSLQQTQANAASAKQQALLAWQSSANDVRTAQASYSSAYHDWVIASSTGADPTTGRPINAEQVAAYKLTMDKADQAEKSAEQAMVQKQVAYQDSQQQEIQQDNIAQSQLTDAQNQLAALTGPPIASDLTAAQAAVDQAQAALNNVTNGFTPADVASAQSSLSQSQASLTKLTQPPTASSLASAEDNVAQAQASVASAQQALDAATLVAPFDGVVTNVAVVPGQMASPSTAAVSIEDDSSMHAVLSLGETDVAKVQVGQAVTITFDALPGQNASGKVTYVSPSATITQNVATYQVQVSLDGMEVPVRSRTGASGTAQATPTAQAPSGTPSARSHATGAQATPTAQAPSGTPSSAKVPAKTGMSATASIVTDTRQNVLEVPNRALTTVGQAKILRVIRQGSQTPTPFVVTTGATDGRYTEITSVVSPSGATLNVGDTVAIIAATTTTGGQNTGFPGGFGGGGFGGGRGGGANATSSGVFLSRAGN
jgi:HlyD family secretion protein